MDKQQAIEAIKILEALCELQKIEKILSTFIKLFKKATLHPDNQYYLHGSFKCTGTKSMRESASDPNLNNLPSNSIYGKLIKSCCIAPKGMLMIGIDFNALEACVNNIISNDPTGAKIAREGYDSHCYNAYSYWKEKCVGIIETVESINSIKELYPKIRQDSKAPTFLMDYTGTAYGLQTTVGMTYQDAHNVYANYQELNKVKIAWFTDRIKEACNQGYAVLAYGGRLRVPALALTVYPSKNMPYRAAKESKTAWNALGQSHGVLTPRACIRIRKAIMASKFKYTAKQCLDIHDAGYAYIPATLEAVKFFNDLMVQEFENISEVPELNHESIKIGGELDVHYLNWSDPVTLPNYATMLEIKEICNAHKRSTLTATDVHGG